ncbi:hypothetical protein HK100_000126, partial [Physocladia obscura]
MSQSIQTFPSWGRKIVAIGRNFAYVQTPRIPCPCPNTETFNSEHAKELGNAVPTAPFFFLKPTSSYVSSTSVDARIEIPKGTNVHHEIELGVVIGRTGRDIAASEAMHFVEGYALAIDVTARDLQDAAKKSGKPWTTAKGFDTFTPVGEFLPKSLIANPDDLRLWLKINGETKQDGPTSDMIFKIPDLIAYVSAITTLERGDVILTGTPAGVGKLIPGDTVTCGLAKRGNNGGDIFNMSFR